MIDIQTPILEETIAALNPGDTITISGYVLCGRDAVLPKIIKMVDDGTISRLGIDLHGQVIFHSAVSIAGVGPTSSNKLEIESSIVPLSKAGVRIHLGKGRLHKETVEKMVEYNSVYAVMPPVSALLESKASERRVLAFPELGMEALHIIKADKFPAIICAAHGRSIYD